MLNAVLVLLVFQLAGETLTQWTGAPVPGPVIGAVLLVVYLLGRGEGARAALSPVAGTILRNLSLLFVPAAVGVIQYGGLIADYGIALIVTLVVSAALTLTMTALVFTLVSRLAGRERERS